MNTFSEYGNDFVGRLLHEAGVWCRTFFGFPKIKTARTEEEEEEEEQQQEKEEEEEEEEEEGYVCKI